MPLDTPDAEDTADAVAEQGEDAEVIKQRLFRIVGEEFNRYGRTGQTIPDRDIVQRISDRGYGCPDMASLQITGSIGNVIEFGKRMEEETVFAQRAGHILKVSTGYKHQPVFNLLVLDLEKSALKGMVQNRVRNIMQLGVHRSLNLPVHEVDVAELIDAIRAA
jgi:hypothetical protein